MKQRTVESELNLKAEEFRKGELLGKYIVKLLYGWDKKRFEEEYWKKMNEN